jgi:N-carbamoyl-L-amino-acid hydrolase
MLFVRNPTGVSHSPQEHASLEDCETAVTALAAILEELTR